MKNKVKVYCKDCKKIYFMEFGDTSELFNRKCEKCGSEDIFFQEFIYETESDKTPIRIGDRGCGTAGRFK